jgi:hypothetical protein
MANKGKINSTVTMAHGSNMDSFRRNLIGAGAKTSLENSFTKSKDLTRVEDIS